jgi:hypothetical protein
VSADPFPDLEQLWVVSPYTAKMARRFRAIFGPPDRAEQRRLWGESERRELLREIAFRLRTNDFRHWLSRDRHELADRIDRALR